MNLSIVTAVVYSSFFVFLLALLLLLKNSFPLVERLFMTKKKKIMDERILSFCSYVYLTPQNTISRNILFTLRYNFVSHLVNNMVLLLLLLSF